MMMESKVDFTLAFRNLSATDLDPFKSMFDDKSAIDTWLAKWRQRVLQDDNSEDDRLDLMRTSNPAFIPRNHRIEQAIRAALEDDFEPFHRLNRVLQNPFEDQPDAEDLTLPPQPKEVVPYTFCGT